jgi:hypothetical protein
MTNKQAFIMKRLESLSAGAITAIGERLVMKIGNRFVVAAENGGALNIFGSTVSADEAIGILCNA